MPSSALRVTNAAIEFFKDESASSIYLYNDKKKRFVERSISD